ncbi:DnaT-like ssDNA-binding protein [Pararhodospirillum photometricum]|nr:DnaT-like ssDNA-binding protein [Pararhodospirillum photometricum]
MSLIAEDGSGRADADSLVALSAADTYWGNRPHTPLAASWTAAAEALREGALREATACLEGRFAARFSGRPRRGRDQALGWPRVGARDAQGAPIADDQVPREIVAACCELAARALSAPLLPDSDPEGRLIEEHLTVDALSTTTVRESGAGPAPIPPLVLALLAPLLGPGSVVCRR